MLAAMGKCALKVLAKCLSDIIPKLCKILIDLQRILNVLVLSMAVVNMTTLFCILRYFGKLRVPFTRLDLAEKAAKQGRLRIEEKITKEGKDRAIVPTSGKRLELF